MLGYVLANDDCCVPDCGRGDVLYWLEEIQKNINLGKYTTAEKMLRLVRYMSAVNMMFCTW